MITLKKLIFVKTSVRHKFQKYTQRILKQSHATNLSFLNNLNKKHNRSSYLVGTNLNLKNEMENISIR